MIPDKKVDFVHMSTERKFDVAGGAHGPIMVVVYSNPNCQVKAVDLLSPDGKKIVMPYETLKKIYELATQWVGAP